MFMLYNRVLIILKGDVWCDRVKDVPVSLNSLWIFSAHIIGSARLLAYSKRFKRLPATQLTCRLAYYIFQKIS